MTLAHLLLLAADEVTLERMGFSLVTRPKQGPCGAQTRTGKPCRSLAMSGRARCRMHGGGSTGPKTLEGRKRVGDATRRRYVEAALADGWAIVSPAVRTRVAAIKVAQNGSQNATARVLGITWSGVRRILAGLPSRPDEIEALEAVATRRP